MARLRGLRTHNQNLATQLLKIVGASAGKYEHLTIELFATTYPFQLTDEVRKALSQFIDEQIGDIANCIGLVATPSFSKARYVATIESVEQALDELLNVLYGDLHVKARF